MENQPKISIIVPVYNVEKYLKACIDSILNQSFKDFEVILVDDGSMDSSGKICDDFARKDSRFKVIHKKNGGVNTARKIGIEKASGTYITFMDADDMFTDNALDVMYKACINNDLDICVGSKYIWTESDKLPNTPISTPKIDEKFLKIFNAQNLDYFHLYEVEWFMVFWGKIFKRELFNNQYIATSLKYGEDQICIKEILFKSQKIMVIPNYVYIYRKRPNSATTKRNKAAFDIFESFDLLEKVLTDYGYINKEYSHWVNWALVSFWFHMKLYLPYMYWWNFVSKICKYAQRIDLEKLKEDDISSKNLKLIRRFNNEKNLFWTKLYYIYKIFTK